MPFARPEAARNGNSLAWPLGSVAVLNLLIIAFAVWTLATSRRQYMERAELTAQNLAQVLEQNLLSQVNQIDLVLLAVKDEVERPGATASQHRIQGTLQTQFSRVGVLEGLRLTDAQGRIVQGTSLPEGKSVSVGDRDYFQHLKVHAEGGLFISRPVIGRITHQWMLILARRLNHPDGSFAGVVYGTLTLDTLGQALAQVEVGPKGSISLRGANLELLVRYPRSPESDRSLGESKIEGDYLRAVQSGRQSTHFTSPSRIDGQPRTYAFRKIARPTFYILVGFAQEDYLQAWRRETLMASLSVAGLVALSLGISWMARSAWHRQARVKAILEAQEAKFRLLAENAEDVIWTADPAGLLTYVSPVVLRQQGYRPEELLGLPLLNHQAPGAGTLQLTIVLESIRSAKPGTQPFAGDPIEAELLRKDGQSLRVELRLRLVWDAERRLVGINGVTQDTTERARQEAEREGLIRELRLALAEVKNLEGMLPICGHCKKIRDDQGYWNILESYLSQHTDATFTHGVCPDCAQTMREEMQARRAQQPRD